MTSTDLVHSAGMTPFPLGWWVTVYGDGDAHQRGETVAHRMDARDAHYVLRRIDAMLDEHGPVRLSRVRTVVRNARRDLREVK